MTICVYVTDPDWVSVLRRHPGQTKVNFWRKDIRNFGLGIGSLFYFKLRGTRLIAGRAVFREQATMTIESAWQEFGYGNGAEYLDEFRERAKSILGLENNQINCLVLEQLELIDEEDYMIISQEDFPNSILAQKFFANGLKFTQSMFNNNIYKDQSLLHDNLDLSATQRDQLIKSRVGQGKFRDKLIAEWSGMCAVTGCSMTSLLRASHIKPWRMSNNQERLDYKNGLLLTANIDALFDNFLISFGEEGNLMMSSTILPQQLEAIGPVGSLRMAPSTQRKVYLEVHRQHFDKLEKLRCPVP